MANVLDIRRRIRSVVNTRQITKAMKTVSAAKLRRAQESALAEGETLGELAAGTGGTWFHNTYPGCACDVQSHLYSFSFAPNPGWTRRYSPQGEIQEYLRG